VKVSILIPAFNRLALVKESLESARRQTYANIEILVSDDGSDGTSEFVETLSKLDPRVRLLPRRAGGANMFTNWNYLVDKSQGDAFCMLADDDRLLPEFVEKLIRPLAEDPEVVASFCDQWMVTVDAVRLQQATDQHSRHYGRADLATGRVADPIAAALKQSISVVSAVYRASVFRREPFDVGCGFAADVDYGVRAALAGPLFYVDERLVEYRAHPGTTTSTKTWSMIDDAIRAYSKHTFENPVHERIRFACLQSRYRAMAVYACTRDRRTWWQSVRMYLQYGGSLGAPTILLSFALALLPHGTAEALRGGLKTVRAGAQGR
jgi:glycosyltransferase involved in cell wall biosynthesis